LSLSVEGCGFSVGKSIVHKSTHATQISWCVRACNELLFRKRDKVSRCKEMSTF
jgi:hypothetical protein